MCSLYLVNVFVKKFRLSIRAKSNVPAGKSNVLLPLEASRQYKKLYFRLCLTKIDDWNGELFLINTVLCKSNDNDNQRKSRVIGDIWTIFWLKRYIAKLLF